MKKTWNVSYNVYYHRVHQLAISSTCVVLGIHYKIAKACIKLGELSHLMQTFILLKSLPKLLLLRSAASPTFFLEVWLLALELHVVVVLEELTPIACILLAA